ncbi:MAG: SPOR domain-containing protein [Saprospiraceae bacterium]
MSKLLADYFPNDKDRNDFFIALVVITFFIAGVLYYILPNRDGINTTPLTTAELAEKVADLEGQRLAFDKHIVTDMEDYRPYYDHRQKEIVYDDRKIDADVGTTTAVAALGEQTLADNEQIESDDSTVIIDDDEVADAGNETTIIIEKETPTLSDEDVKDAILEEVPPNLNEDGSVVESETETVEDDPNNEDELAAAAALEAERERERLAAAAKAERAKKEKLARERTAKRKKKQANTLSGCHVIVGAFKSSRNARSFREKVKAENFSVATGTVSGKMYVGVPVPCGNEATIKQTQERVNAAFGIKSWVLRK